MQWEVVEPLSPPVNPGGRPEKRRGMNHPNGMYLDGRPGRSSCEALWLSYWHDSMSPQTAAMCCWLGRSATCRSLLDGTLGVLEMDDDVGGELFGNAAWGRRQARGRGRHRSGVDDAAETVACRTVGK